MKNLNLKLSKIFAFVTSVFLILALASCSELFSDPEKTGSVSFSLSPEVARAIPSRNLAGYSFDKDIDFSLDDDDPNTYIFAVSLSGDYSETQYKSYTEAEFTSLGNDSTITFSEIPVGSKVKASVTLSIKDSTGTYPWYEGTSDSKEIVEGTNSIDLKITKKQYACKFNVYIKGDSDYELSSEYSKTLTGDLMAIDENLVESLESLYETLLQKGYILNEEKIDLWMPKLTGDSTLESSIYFDLPGSSEPGEDEPEKDPTKLKFEFYLQGDDGNYTQSDDYPAVDFDITEDYDDEQLENLVKEKITEYALKIAIEGYTVNDEKTDASIEDMEIIDDCIVVKFYLDKDKAEDEPGEDEPGEDEPGEEPTKTVTVGGITVTLAETSVTDEGENVTLEVTPSADKIVLTVTPSAALMDKVGSCNWNIEGLNSGKSIEGGKEYTLLSTDIESLDAGIHHVTVSFDVAGDDNSPYSASTTFTVTAE